MTERFEIGYTESNGLMCVGLYDTERDIWGAGYAKARQNHEEKQLQQANKNNQ